MLFRCAIAITAFLAVPCPAMAAQTDRFENNIRPLLAKHCFSCHSQTQMGGLRLDSRAAMLTGGKSGAAIVPGKPEASLLMKAVGRINQKLQMPPAGPLASAELSELAAWIRDGAIWPETKIVPGGPQFWSFRNVQPPAIPPALNNWPKGKIDRLIAVHQKNQKLYPVGEADRRTWLRRVTLDLTGIPPTPEEVAAFQANNSPEAYELTVDRLLASPKYGERWGRHWLDVMRYSDDLLDTPLLVMPNFHPYRDWVIQAMNADMPYDLFLKSHLAADLLPNEDNNKLLPAMTMFVDAPSDFNEDDRVDVVTRGFLGLTVACAKCHDHKYDPVPTKDYYSLLGVFRNTQFREVPLAENGVVSDYQRRKEAADEQNRKIKEFLTAASQRLVAMEAAKTARYLVAAAKGTREAVGLDSAIIDRCISLLKRPVKQHPFLHKFEALRAQGAAEKELLAEAQAIQELALKVLREKDTIDEFNEKLRQSTKIGRDLNDVQGKAIPRDRYMFWQDLAAVGNPRASSAVSEARVDGVYMFPGDKVLPFLSAEDKSKLADMRTEAKRLQQLTPKKYPYLTVLADAPEPRNLHVFLRGNPQSLGEEAPRSFLTVFRDLFPEPFRKGSGRLELAEAIASTRNPLTARVMVNRLWEWHFGYGLVRTPSNFGQTGDRPAMPDLLDYLASRFIEQGWSMKKLHREIVLSAAYRERSENNAANFQVDPDNRYHWRFPLARLDAEALRDSMLFVSGKLDPAVGGEAVPLTSQTNFRRTVYGKISRRAVDPMLRLFDFPDPNTTAERRLLTTVPLQRLFLLNSEFLMAQGRFLAKRLDDENMAGAEQRVHRIYQLLFQRAPTASEKDRGLSFIATGGASAWADYARILLSSDEFLYVE